MGSFTPTSFTHEGGPRIDKEPGQPDILPELSGLAPKKGKIYLPWVITREGQAIKKKGSTSFQKVSDWGKNLVRDKRERQAVRLGKLYLDW